MSRYVKNLADDGKDFIKAAEFNIEISKKTDNSYEKEMFCHAAFFVELLRAGKVLVNNIDEKFLQYVKNTNFYKLSIITRQEGLKQHLKPKLKNRKKLCENFLQNE